jgi:hypothetical protein
VSGVLKAPTEITETVIAPKFCLLEMVDDTSPSHDPTLRRGFGMFEKPEFESVVGLSGSPVFNVTQSALCGTVVRGLMTGDSARCDMSTCSTSASYWVLCMKEPVRPST